MVNSKTLNLIHTYLRHVMEAGIQVRQAVLFGSWARGEQHTDSDIDLIVIAPEFDEPYGRELIDRLWKARMAVPNAWRIEPIACGERQWVEDDSRAIIEIARREGQIITSDLQIT